MLVAVDIGNTNIVIGVFLKDRFLNFRLSTNPKLTQDEYCINLYNLFNLYSLREKITGSIVSSVVPQITPRIINAIKTVFDIKPMEVGPGIKTGMLIKYHNPAEVGADRIVNAVGAYEEFKDALIVIDSGTAITFDVISKKGEYIGGAIAPGINISADALALKTAKLPRVPLQMPKEVIGKTTMHSMQSGLFYGYLSMIEGMINRIKDEMGHECVVVITGGDSALFYKHLNQIDHYRPYLTLFGLKAIYEKNI
ncbi:type III pantothenate kinase [Hippea maritima]|uniref:Type III pantothenate kinase n=1 Tax=Hippea maritima (strain ATCC 700847 / DSM 10411 / MH2) TaxID=760142 RepID=F2LVQ2_HIPMA|nr:type III pantothenate kinase [Hippea maritima]AEA33836.1 putative transcriptional acitvator, Baf family [Hippea maritima DSM 10411]